MNRKQRAWIVFGFSLIMLSLLFPPASVHHPAIPGLIGASYSPVSYGFLFTVKGKIDFVRLFVEWLLIALLTGGLVYVLRGPDTPKPERKAESLGYNHRNWRRPFSLSIVLYVLIAGLSATSYVSLRKVRRLEGGIQLARDVIQEPPSKFPPLSIAPLNDQQVLEAYAQYHYTADMWAAWVVAERHNLVARSQQLQKVKDELDRLR